MNRVLMVAAENAALPGGKVGGIGDVVRDLPVALADAGWTSTVLTPSYGFLHELPGATRVRAIDVPFGGRRYRPVLYRVPGDDERVEHYVLEHKLFSPDGAGHIYVDDGAHRPFASDASKFAFFCAATAAWLRRMQQRPDVIHLHDWHAASLLLLRAFDPAYRELKDLRCVYTIHNLALQGIRPRDGDDSSLEHWFPELEYETAVVDDPRYPDCVNPMALGIRLADRVNAVSPTYAREILLPNNPAHGFFGGEGLEADARAAAADGRLIGILNGCVYPETWRPSGWKPLLRELVALPAHMRASARLDAVLSRYSDARPRHVVTSVGRITDQKVTLFLETVSGAGHERPTALDAILNRLGPDSLFIMLGSGDPELEQRLEDIIARHDNAIFVRGYSEPLSDHMYDCGDLFLMPSSFEPCGISQMLAMRAGQPCVVHGVGGLRDTVHDGDTGFVFEGRTPAEQAQAFVTAFDTALHVREISPARWEAICRRAAAQRFTWGVAGSAYAEQMYRDDDTEH